MATAGIYDMQLEELVRIKGGYAFGGKVEHEPGGTYAVIQSADVEMNGIGYEGLVRVHDIDPLQHHFVSRGDVLFVPRGPRNYAVYIDRDLENTVPVSQLYILRPKEGAERIDPAYLAWYLNQEPAQTYFDTFARGSTIRMVNQQVLGELTVPVPHLDVQRQVVEIDCLARREANLAQQVMQRRESLIRTLLLNAITN